MTLQQFRWALIPLLMLTGCTGKTDIDARIDEYMKTKGQAQVEEAVRKVLSEAAEGKPIASPQTRESARVQIPTEGSPVLGNPAAKHTLIVFIDYTDPFSGQLMSAAQAVMKDAKDDLKVVVKFAPAPQRGLSIPAARAAAAAQELGKFSEYHSRVINQQTQISQNKLLEWAKDLGISSTDFVKKMEQSETAGMLKKHADELTTIGGGSAPMAFLDGVRLERGEQSPQAIKQWLSRSALK